MAKRLLLVGASGGIGAALQQFYRNQGYDIIALSRRDDGLDLTNAASVDQTLNAIDGQFDLIICATGALDGAGRAPEKSLGALSAEAMAAQFAVNTIGPAMVLRHVPRLLAKDKAGVFAALSARVGSIGDNRLGGWYSYRSAKAALNQVIRCAAIELKRTHPHSICLALHPGTVATSFTSRYQAKDKLAPLVAAEHLAHVIAQKTPQHTGRFFDWQDKEIPW